MNYLIQKGNASVSVLKIQQCLNQIQPELHLKEDGLFDENTEQAIIEFQMNTGLTPDSDRKGREASSIDFFFFFLSSPEFTV